MSPAVRLASIPDAEAMLAASQSRPVILFKHSASCPVSAVAKLQVGALRAADDTPVYVVVVQKARAVSDWLADALDVRHETPQAVVIAAGTAVHVETHGRVRASSLRAAVAAHAAVP